MLNDFEVHKFWNDGFLTISDVFPAEELNALREVTNSAQIQEELRKRNADERVVHLIPLTTRNPAFLKLARDPRLTHRVAALIGQNLQISNSKLATKPKMYGAGEFHWHQDFAFYTATNFDMVSVALALDDSTPENGGMFAVKGSHKLGPLNHFEDGWMNGRCTESHLWDEKTGQVCPLMTPAGGLTIHHCLTLHGSPGNVSGRPRRLVIFQYRASDCYQLADHVWDDTGYQVLGKPSGQVRCVEGTLPLPKNRGWERYCGEPHGSVYRQIGAAAKVWNSEDADEVEVTPDEQV